MDDLVRYSILATFLQKIEQRWPGRYFGMTIVQKLMYFFTATGHAALPDYAYKFYHYGPYCDQLDTDLRVLNAAGVIAIEADREGLGFKLSTKNPEVLDLSLSEEFWASHHGSFEKVCDELGFQKPQDYELLATIHYVYQALYRHEGQDAEELMSLVGSLKPKFDKERIQNAYNLLVNKALLEATY